MSNPHLPPEILDHIVDLLHDDPDSLEKCCLVSKSWIPRTRKHIFAHIKFDTEEDLESWKAIFPDPSTSPAHYANTLYVGCPHLVTPADSWIRGFSRVVELELATYDTYADESAISLISFHGLSLVIKSLRVDFNILPPSRILNLILSFPLLEDLTLTSTGTPTDSGDGPDVLPTAIQPSNPPTFTGSLVLNLEGGTIPIARWLLTLPGGLHFRKFTSTWRHGGGLLLTMALVEECSYTLESLDVSGFLPAEMNLLPIDLSKATMLKDVAFWAASRVECITMALQTITPKHRYLRRISIFVADYSIFVNIGGDVGQIAGDQTLRQWLELDRLLARLWESHSIRPRIKYNVCPGQEKAVIDSVARCLLPETTGRGIIDLVGIQ